jgi:hypothetical protein
MPATVTRRIPADLTAMTLPDLHDLMRRVAGQAWAVEFAEVEEAAVIVRSRDLPNGGRYAASGLNATGEASQAATHLLAAQGRAVAATMTLPDSWRSPGGADAAYVLAMIAEEVEIGRRAYLSTFDAHSRGDRMAAVAHAAEVQHAALCAAGLADYLTH